MFLFPLVLSSYFLVFPSNVIFQDIIWTLVGAVLYISAGIWTIYLLESDVNKHFFFKNITILYFQNSKEKQRIETASGSFRTKIYNFQPDRHSSPLFLIFLKARPSTSNTDQAGLNTDQRLKCFQLVFTLPEHSYHQPGC